jgi:hypothetical protein
LSSALEELIQQIPMMSYRANKCSWRTPSWPIGGTPLWWSVITRFSLESPC